MKVLRETRVTAAFHQIPYVEMYASEYKNEPASSHWIAHIL